jgi:hypothetical protein
VVPLAIYLLTFILASGAGAPPAAVVAITLPLVLLVIFLMVSSLPERIWITVLWHLALLFVVALGCHGALALDRPAPRHLTEFYLLISVGGVLGGLFNALVAPIVFPSLIEYPLVMVLACVLLHARGGARIGLGAGAVRAAALALGAVALALVLYSESATLRVDFSFLGRVLDWSGARVSEWLDPTERLLNKLLIYGPPLAVTWLLRRRPLHLGAALAGILLVAGFVDARNSDQIARGSFFGVLGIRATATTRATLSRATAPPCTDAVIEAPSLITSGRSHRPALRRAGPAPGRAADGGDRPRHWHPGAYAFPATGDVLRDRCLVRRAFDPRHFTYAGRDRGASLRMELGDTCILDAVARSARGYDDPGGRLHLGRDPGASPHPGGPAALLRHAGGARHPRAAHLQPLPAPRAGGILRTAVTRPPPARRHRRCLRRGERGPSWPAGPRFYEMALPAGRSPLEPEPRVGVWTDDFHNLLAVFKW